MAVFIPSISRLYKQIEACGIDSVAVQAKELGYMMHRRIIACLAAFVSLPGACFAAGEIETVHWAYSSFFGTGWYQVDDNRSVFVFRIPPRQTVRTSSFENGQRKIGVEIHYPLTLGLHNLDFEDLPGNIDIDNFGSASFTPGVELEIPVNERWTLRPFAKAGWGKEFENNESAWIWETGIKARYMIPSERVDWALLGNLHWAGHNSSNTISDDILSILLGAEARQPLNKTMFGREIDLHWHTTYTHLDREVKFSNADGTKTAIDDIFEIGLAVSFRDERFNFWLWKPDRLGLGIQFSPDGDFSAITFTSRSWFTK